MYASLLLANQLAVYLMRVIMQILQGNLNCRDYFSLIVLFSFAKKHEMYRIWMCKYEYIIVAHVPGTLGCWPQGALVHTLSGSRLISV